MLRLRFVVAAALAGAAVVGFGLGCPPEASGDGAAAPPRGRRAAAIVELGRRLFFDPVVSRSGVRSCASCHDPDHGFSDPARTSADDFGRTRRHSQTLLDSADNPTAHWDGEFASVEDLVLARLGMPDGVRRDVNALARLVALAAKGETSSSPGGKPDSTGGGSYDSSGTPSESTPSSPEPAPSPETPRGETPPEDDDPAEEVPGEDEPGDADDVEEAPAESEPDDKKAGKRSDPSLRLGHGAPVPDAFDLRRLVPPARRVNELGRYAEGFTDAFGTSKVTTARVAEAIAAYVATIRSHEAPFDRWRRGDAAAMSDAAIRGFEAFRRVGCAACHVDKGPRPAFTDYEFHNTGVAARRLAPGTDPESVSTAVLDPGRARIDTASAHRRSFKTPTLRDVARRAPYMHDGSLATLEEVVDHYARGGLGEPLRDERLRPFAITKELRSDLVAFLCSLSSEVRPGLAPTLWTARAETTRVRIVDGAGRPMRGLPVAVAASGDTLPGDLPRTSARRELRTDDQGWIEYPTPFRTHARLDLPDGLEAVGGNLVPDTCRRAVLRVPVDGRAALTVAFPPDQAAPALLVLEHETEMALPAPMVPRTTLVRESDQTVGRRTVARYVGWFRSDESPWVRIRLPGDRRTAEVPRVRLVKDGTVEHRVEE